MFAVIGRFLGSCGSAYTEDMPGQIMPSATSHYIGCLAIDQYFRSSKSRSAGGSTHAELCRKSPSGFKTSTKSRAIQTVQRSTEATVKLSRNTSEYQEAPRRSAKRQTANRRFTPRRTPNDTKAFAGRTWQTFENWTFGGSARRFGVPRSDKRNTSGYSEAFRHSIKKWLQRHFGITSGLSEQVYNASSLGLQLFSGRFGLFGTGTNQRSNHRIR